MIEIKTFVYFDLESTGLLKTSPKITELSCLALGPMELAGDKILHKIDGTIIYIDTFRAPWKAFGFQEGESKPI